MVLKHQPATKVQFHQPGPLIGESKKKLKYVKVLKGKCLNEVPKPEPPKKRFYIPGSYQVKNNLAKPPGVDRIYLEPRPISKYWSKKYPQETNPPQGRSCLKKSSPVSHYCPKSRSVNTEKYRIKRPDPVEDVSYSSSSLDRKQKKLLEHCEETCKDHAVKPSTSSALLGYDWIQSYVDDLDNGIIWKDDKYFEELKQFREKYKDECVCPTWKGYLDQDKCVSFQESRPKLSQKSVDRHLVRVEVPKDFSVFIHNKTRIHNKDSLALSQNRQ